MSRLFLARGDSQTTVASTVLVLLDRVRASVLSTSGPTSRSDEGLVLGLTSFKSRALGSPLGRPDALLSSLVARRRRLASIFSTVVCSRNSPSDCRVSQKAVVKIGHSLSRL